MLGNPTKVDKIGDTFIPYQVFKDYLRGLAESTYRWEREAKKIYFILSEKMREKILCYRGTCYSLLKHNCNTFTEDLCQFLCGSSIPKYILDLPQEFLSTPIGQSLRPLIGKRSLSLSSFLAMNHFLIVHRLDWSNRRRKHKFFVRTT